MSKIEKKPIKPLKLTRAEKQSIANAVQRANNKPKGVKSAQDSIPYRHIFPDGICHVGDIPSDLATYGGEAKKLLADLQSRNERMFLITFLVLNTADSKKELDNILLQASGIANKHNCTLIRLDYQQEQGFMTSLPLGKCFVPIQRSLTTSSTAIFVPFTTQELFQSGGEALYYGLSSPIVRV